MSDLHAPLLPAYDGHGAGGESGASMTPAPSNEPVDLVAPKPEQPDTPSEPRRDDSETEGAAGRGVPAGHRSGGGVEVKSEEEKKPGDAAGVSPDAAADESDWIIQSSSAYIDPQPSHASGILKDLEADFAGASTTAARMEVIKNISRRLAELAASSSMESEVLTFLRAVERFNSKKDGKKKVMDTEVCQAGRLLSDAACRAPSSDAAVAKIAAKLAGHSQDVLLSLSSDGGFRPWAFLREWILRAARPEPALPVHSRERQEKLTDKRQVLFGIAVAAPLALLTTAVPAGVQVFPSAFGPCIAGIGALLWIAVTCGLVIDLFDKTRLEFQVASCLSHLGMMAVSVLFCLFIFGAFFPAATSWMWFLVVLAVALHGALCLMSLCRGDTNE